MIQWIFSYKLYRYTRALITIMPQIIGLSHNIIFGFNKNMNDLSLILSISILLLLYKIELIEDIKEYIGVKK